MKFLLRGLATGLLWAGLALVSPAHAANELGTGICETTNTTGTGTLSLSGAYTTGGVTYLGFASQITSGNSVPYTITAADGKFEHGTTVFTDAGTDTLTRNALWSSDGSGVELTLPAGPHIVCLQIGEASHGDGDRGDITVSDGFQAWGIDADSVALTTDTTGNYVATVTENAGFDGACSSEACAYSPTLDFTEITPTVTWGGGSFTTMTFDVGASDVAFEFATGTMTVDINGTNETTLTTTAFSPGVDDGNALGTSSLRWADIFLATGGTIEWDGGTTNTMTCTGGNCTIEGNTMYRAGGTDVAVADGGTGASSLTDLITLGTMTTGNYVDNVTGGSGITVTHTPAEGSEPDIVFDATELSSVTWGAGAFTTMTYNAGAVDPSFTFGSGTVLMEGVVSFRQADAANAGGSITLREDPGTGSDSLGFLAPASVTTSQTCTLENDASFIPDSCVGDGSDADTLGSDGDKGDIVVGGTGTTLAIDAGVIVVADFLASAVVTAGEGLSSSDNDTSFPTTAAVIDGIAAKPEAFIVAASDETTTLTTGADKATFRMPYAFTVTAVRCSLNVAATTGTFTADINENDTSILGNKVTFDATETTSFTATTAATITDAAIANDAEVEIDIDSIGSTGAPAGLKCTLIGNQ